MGICTRNAYNILPARVTNFISSQVNPRIRERIEYLSE